MCSSLFLFSFLPSSNLLQNPRAKVQLCNIQSNSTQRPSTTPTRTLLRHLHHLSLYRAWRSCLISVGGLILFSFRFNTTGAYVNICDAGAQVLSTSSSSSHYTNTTYPSSVLALLTSFIPLICYSSWLVDLLEELYQRLIHLQGAACVKSHAGNMSVSRLNVHNVLYV